MISNEPPITPELDRRARPQAGRIRAHRQADRPRAELHRARHLLGDVERALLVQIVENPSAHAADQGAVGDPGAGRERRRHRHRRRACRRVQDGEPQPPELHRALSGRGDRRRRHLARRLHHGRAADRLPQRALVRRSETSEDAPARRRRRRRHRRLRQFVRRADRRRRGAVSTAATTAIAWSMPWRSASPRPTRFSIRRRPASACRSSISARRPAATASMAPPWPRPSSAPTPRRSARPCRSAIRSPKSCCSKPASRSWPKAASSPSRTWARRVSPARRSRWAPRAISASRSISTRCRAARPA